MPLFDQLVAFTGIGLGPLVLAMVMTAIASTVQGTIGFGFAMLAVPVLSIADPRLAPVPQMLMVIPLVLRMAWRERFGIDWPGVGWIVLGRLPGAAVGIALVSTFSRSTLDLVIAGIIAAAVVIAARPAPQRDGSVKPPRPALRVAAGLFSGTSSYVSSIGGPPIALLYRDAKGPTLRASLAMIFCVGLTITVTSRFAAGHVTDTDMRVAVVMVPFVLLGLVISGRLAGRVEGGKLRGMVLAASGLAAFALAGRTLFG